MGIRKSLVGCAAVLSLGLGAGLTGCSSTPTTSSSPSSSPSSSSSSPSSTSSPSTVRLDFGANHSTVRITVGTPVWVELAGPYWSGISSSDEQVLAPVPFAHPLTTPSGALCHPGTGCGGQQLGSFVARHAGTAQLTASRNACGEAMACAPDQRTFTVTVVVTG